MASKSALTATGYYFINLAFSNIALCHSPIRAIRILPFKTLRIFSKSHDEGAVDIKGITSVLILDQHLKQGQTRSGSYCKAVQRMLSAGNEIQQRKLAQKK